MPIQLRKKGLPTKLAQQFFGYKQEKSVTSEQQTIPWKPKEDSFEQSYRQLDSWRQRR